MKIKRLLSLLVAAAMTVSMLPSFVLAKEFDYEPDEPEAVETSEPAEEETQPEAKKPTKPEAEEPDDTKEGESSEPKTEEPAESKEEEPAGNKDEEPSETKGEEPGESKAEEPVESETEQPADEKEEEPAETGDENPAEEEEQIPEEVLKSIRAKIPGRNIKGQISSDNDERFDRFVESKFTKKQAAISRKAASVGSRFTGAYKIMYDQLKTQIAAAANGEYDPSTTFHIDMDDQGTTVSSWTAKQLGVKSILEYDASSGQYKITDAAYNAFVKTVNINTVVIALLADCPYELYWYDKEKGVDLLDTMIGVRRVGNVDALYFVNGISVAFYVAYEYAVDDFRINGSKIARVNDSIKFAENIVKAAKDKSDYKKLEAYCKAICDLVEYDHAAAADDSMPYGDPWQLVSVFDDDPKTNVVCEGYAKAFKYLCDLTSFSRTISCITVAGTSTYNGTSGGHMWNVVKMENGRNYIVDVTNCDDGCCGSPDKLFLAGYFSGNVNDGYTFRCGYGTSSNSLINYVYYGYTKSTYGNDLIISDTNYITAEVSGTCGDNLTWSIKGNTLTISGTGDMYDFDRTNTAPWDNYAKSITNVVLPEGLTSIGNYAFYLFSGVKNIKIPTSVKKIGVNSFYGCVNLTGIKIPNDVASIGSGAFYSCLNLSRVTIKEDLHKKLDATVFMYCSKAVFYDYQVLGNYELQITNPATNGTGTATIVGMASPTEAVTIPASVADTNGYIYKINRIAADSFYQDKTIRTLSIGSNVLAIEGNAFYGCSNLTKVTGGKGLKAIGTNAFAYCTKLSSFTITSSVLNKIGATAFNMDSKLKTLNIKKTKKLSKSGVKNSLKGSSVKTVKVKKSKIRKYKKYFKKSNSGRKVKVKK